MLLENLVIENYGVYGGRNEFDLSTTPEKPIVLVGGLNGAGKTTILESMMMALYGRAYFGSQRPKKEYVRFVADRVHRSGRRRTSSAAVSLAFRFYHGASEDVYEVRRSWIAEGKSVAETLAVRKNGEEMVEVDESQWQSFIDSLLPLGIARLFFFDGEKITRVTEPDGKQNEEMHASLETLIGADLVHRLHSDLGLYMLRKSKNGPDGLEAEYGKLADEKAGITSDIAALSAELDSKKSEIGEAESHITHEESKVSVLGGGYADLRSELLTKRAVLTEKSKDLERRIHERLAGNAPLHLMPSMLSRIGKQLDEDAKATEDRLVHDAVERLSSALKKKVSEAEFWPKGTDSDLATSRVLTAVDELSPGAKGQDPFFDLSVSDMAEAERILAEVRRGHAGLDADLQSYADAAISLEKAESDLAKIPNDDEMGPHVSEINKMHEEIGALRAEAAHLEQQISTRAAYKRIVQNRMAGMMKSIHGSKNSAAGVELAGRMQAVLDTYHAAIKERKIRDLEANLLDTARMLLHKAFISRIKVDRDTFEIRTYAEDSQIPGDLLSMGERQIVGTALLWAMARTCGHALPFVIDTPLGRLDGSHLSNLVERFYPHASHQVVLLSTDREIGPREYEMLSGHVSRSYRISHDSERASTSVTRGYFGGETHAQA